MGLDPYWSMEKQFKRHDPFKERDAEWDRRLVDGASRTQMEIAKQIGLNEFGRPEGIFFYGNDRNAQTEHACDLDVQELKDGTGHVQIVCAGVQILCPRCGSPLYVKSKGLGGHNEIHIHWDKLVRSTVDGKIRPSFTIEGTFGCDYSDHEITGVTPGRDSRVQMRCGWRGGITEGTCRDHQIARQAK